MGMNSLPAVIAVWLNVSQGASIGVTMDMSSGGDREVYLKCSDRSRYLADDAIVTTNIITYLCSFLLAILRFLILPRHTN